MKYTIVIEKLAEKFIMKLPRDEKERVLKAIYQLPDGNDIKELKGRKNKGLYRLRVGEYRIIYTIDNGKLIICVIDAGNRGQIYNKIGKRRVGIDKSAGGKSLRRDFFRLFLKVWTNLDFFGLFWTVLDFTVRKFGDTL